MIIHRFYVNQKLEVGERFLESVQIVHQLSKVLRIRPGEPVIFFDESGFDYTAEILFYSEGGVRIKINERKKNNHEFSVALTVCHALIKKDLMEFIFQKGTEIGVSSFWPVIAERSIQKEVNIERGRKIVKEAAEQSGRAHLPLIREPRMFKESLNEAREREGARVIVCDTDISYRISHDAFNSLFSKKDTEIFLYIGPEGGFSPDEIMYAKNAGATVVSLYPTTLRAETAAVVLPALVLARYIGDE